MPSEMAIAFLREISRDEGRLGLETALPKAQGGSQIWRKVCSSGAGFINARGESYQIVKIPSASGNKEVVDSQINDDICCLAYAPAFLQACQSLSVASIMSALAFDNQADGCFFK